MYPSQGFKNSLLVYATGVAAIIDGYYMIFIQEKKMTVFVCSVEPVSTGVAVQIRMLEKRERCCESKRRVRSEVFVQLLNAGKVVQTDGLTFYNSSPPPLLDKWWQNYKR